MTWSVGLTVMSAEPVERFWTRRNASYEVTDAGLLVDPDSTFLSVSRNRNAIPTRQLRAARCLVLLGEPGMGKSKTLSRGADLTPDACTRLVNVNLANVFSADNLHAVLDKATESGLRTKASLADRSVIRDPAVDTVGDVADEVARDQADDSVGEVAVDPVGDTGFCLFLDSLDDAQRQLPRFVQALQWWLTATDCSRFDLRIACRTAEWSSSLEATLKELFGEVQLVELLPLRAADVGRLATDRLGSVADADTFTAEVVRVGLGPLAARPITLKMLLDIYDADGGFPSRAADVYEKGLLLLCVLDNGPDEHLSDTPAQRLAVASRAAAMMRVSGRVSIWNGQHSGACSADLTVDDVHGRTEPYASTSVPVLVDLIRRTFRTGLFTGSGEDRLTWAHSTFTDFLAARWIVTNDLTRRQVAGLLQATDGKVFPQLRHTAAWLVAHQPVTYRWLVDVDPESFVLDVDIPDQTVRAAVVDSLLGSAGRDELASPWGNSYRGLGHPGLGEQLRPHIREGNPQVRSLALRIASQLHVPDLLDALADVACDDGADMSDRVTAAYVVAHHRSTHPTDRLAALIHSGTTAANANATTDSGDSSEVDHAAPGSWRSRATAESELRGAALEASWPHALSTAGVLATVTGAGPRRLYGLEKVFLSNLSQAFGPGDVPAVVAWLDRLGAAADEDELAGLTNAAVLLCLDHTDDPAVLPSLARLVLRRVDTHLPLLLRDHGEPVTAVGVEARRALLLEVLGITAQEDVFWYAVAGASGPRLVYAEDFRWLAEVHPTLDPPLRLKTAELLIRLLHWADPDQMRFLGGLRADDPILTILDSHLVVDLASEYAKYSRGELDYQQKHKEREQREAAGSAMVDIELATRIDAGLAGASDAFIVVQQQLTIDESARRIDHSDDDLTAQPRWQQLDSERQAQVVAMAGTFLRSRAARTDDWYSQNVIPFTEQAGYRALVLMLTGDSAGLDGLDSEVWISWAPAVALWPCYTDASWARKEQLLIRCRPHAAAELTAMLAQLIANTGSGDLHLSHHREADLLWSGPLADAVAVALKQAGPTAQQSLAQLLAKHDRDHLARVLVQLITDPVPAADVDADRGPDVDTVVDSEQEPGSEARQASRTDAVQLLLRLAPAEGWPLIESLFSTDPALLRTAVLGLDDHHADLLTQGLEPAKVATLCTWLMTQFPVAEDPEADDESISGWRSAASGPTARFWAGRWRDHLITSITAAGTPAAVEALEGLVARWPDMPWLRQELLQARNSLRTSEFTLVPPGRLLQIAHDRAVRLVRGSSQLRELTVEAFIAIQQLLSGDTPDAPLLWDTRSGQPKTEDECSDYVCNRLVELLVGRGVVINREVQIRRSQPSGVGERVDLKIEAVIAGSSSDPFGASGDAPSGDAVSVAVEVKGIWNADLTTALDEQLVDRYMRDLGTRDGIFAVLVFDPDEWTGDRQSASRRALKNDARTVLEAQAAQQTLAGRRVDVVWLNCSRRRSALM